MPLTAPIKPRRNHETPASMANASLTDRFFEVPTYLAADTGMRPQEYLVAQHFNIT